MRKLTIVILGVILVGCYCRRCHGQAVNVDAGVNVEKILSATSVASLVNTDTTLSATESYVWQYVCGHHLRLNPGDEPLLDLHKTAFGATGATTINTAQYNRWLNPSDKGSFLGLSAWKLTLRSMRTGEKFHPLIYSIAESLAPTAIKDTAKLKRYTDNLTRLQSPPEDYENGK